MPRPYTGKTQADRQKKWRDKKMKDEKFRQKERERKHKTRIYRKDLTPKELEESRRKGREFQQLRRNRLKEIKKQKMKECEGTNETVESCESTRRSQRIREKEPEEILVPLISERQNQTLQHTESTDEPPLPKPIMYDDSDEPLISDEEAVQHLEVVGGDATGLLQNRRPQIVKSAHTNDEIPEDTTLCGTTDSRDKEREQLVNMEPEEVALTQYEVADKMKRILEEAVQTMCRECLTFSQFVFVSGMLNFNIDNQSTTNINLQKMVHRQGSDGERAEQNDPNTNLSMKQELQQAQCQYAADSITSQHKELETSAIAETVAEKGPEVAPPKKVLPPIAIKQEVEQEEVEDYEDDAEVLDDSEDPEWSPPMSGYSQNSAGSPRKRKSKRSRGSTSTKSVLAESAKSEGSSSLQFQCQHCVYTTKFPGHFRNHSKRHGLQGEEIEELITSYETRYETTSKSNGQANTANVEIHEASKMRSQDSKENIETDSGHCCEQCGESFACEEDLEQHQNSCTGDGEDKYECPYCSKRFRTKPLLRKHAKKIHGKTGKNVLFSCDVCNKSMASHAELEKHVEAKHNYICSICGESFTRMTTLRKHRASAHLEEGLTCHICQKKHKSHTALRKHIKRHDTTQKYSCDVCGKMFTAQSTLYHHKRGVHGNVKPYKCTKCDKAFNFHHSLKLHLLWHNGQRPFKCQVCTKTYLTSAHLKGHVDAVHGAHKKYKCPICSKSFPYENSLKMHMMLHTGERPFMCSMCGRGFVCRSALKAHEATHTSTGKSYECDVCHKKYKTEHLMRAHRRRHTTDGSRYMCDICGLTFMYKSNLEAHSSSHSSERNFTCSECGKSFKTYATLYSHKLVHKTETPYKCPVCRKEFKSKERMAAHERRHLGLKPFKCAICDRCFPDKGGLSKHTKTVHGVRKFACPVCGKTCSRADNMRVHLKIHRDPELLKMDLKPVQDGGEDSAAEEETSPTIAPSHPVNMAMVPTASQPEHVQNLSSVSGYSAAAQPVMNSSVDYTLQTVAERIVSKQPHVDPGSAPVVPEQDYMYIAYSMYPGRTTPPPVHDHFHNSTL